MYSPPCRVREFSRQRARRAFQITRSPITRFFECLDNIHPAGRALKIKRADLFDPPREKRKRQGGGFLSPMRRQNRTHLFHRVPALRKKKQGARTEHPIGHPDFRILLDCRDFLSSPRISLTFLCRVANISRRAGSLGIALYSSSPILLSASVAFFTASNVGLLSSGRPSCSFLIAFENFPPAERNVFHASLSFITSGSLRTSFAPVSSNLPSATHLTKFFKFDGSCSIHIRRSFFLNT